MPRAMRSVIVTADTPAWAYTSFQKILLQHGDVFVSVFCLDRYLLTHAGREQAVAITCKSKSRTETTLQIRSMSAFASRRTPAPPSLPPRKTGPRIRMRSHSNTLTDWCS